MNTSPLDDLKTSVASEPLDRAFIDIIYELKSYMTVMWSTISILAIANPDHKDEVDMVEGYLTGMLGVIDEVMIKGFLPRLRSNSDTSHDETV